MRYFQLRIIYSRTVSCADPLEAPVQDAVMVTIPPFVSASASTDVYVATGSAEPSVGPLSDAIGFAVPWPSLVKLHTVAPAGGVQVICVDWPPFIWFGFKLTVIGRVTVT